MLKLFLLERQLIGVWSLLTSMQVLGAHDLCEEVIRPSSQTVPPQAKGGIQQVQIADGEKHRPAKELLDLWASARASESSASMETEPNQSLRDEVLSMRRELSQTGIDIDQLGMELLRPYAESVRLDQELRQSPRLDKQLE